MLPVGIFEADLLGRQTLRRQHNNNPNVLHLALRFRPPACTGTPRRHKNTDSPLPFIEVFVDIPVEEAEKRDPKGLYKKARAGEIKEFTGISAPYEAPEKAEVHIHSEKTSVEEAVVMITEYLEKEGLLKV